MFEIFDMGGVFVATVLAYLAGWAWYSKILWQKPWMEALGKTDADVAENKLEFARSMLYGFFATLATALGVKALLLFADPGTFLVAIDLVLVVVFAFGVTTKFTELIYESKDPHWSKKPQILLLIGSGYQIVSALIITAVLWFW